MPLQDLVTVAEVLVGAGVMFTADTDTSLPVLPAAAPTNGWRDAFLDDTSDWTNVGGTQDGVELAFEPDYGEVEADQVKDAIILFNQGTKVSLRTNLLQSSLENLALAWGYDPSTVITTGSGRRTLAIGVMDDDPVEKAVVVIGRAPKQTGDHRERIYHGRRAVSLEGSTFPMRKNEATTFAISFRLLPDPSYDGSEYGEVIDEIT